MIILISNDDGICSEGLAALEKSLVGLGEVWTVAPDQPRNAVGRSVTLDRPLKASRLSERRYRVDGTPTDCINLAVNGLLPERPALVVSGINMGGNMGDDISYSGTAAAAFEATILSIPAFAVSLDCRMNFSFEPGAAFALRLARFILDHGLPAGTFLNVNVPDTNGAPLHTYKVTRQGRSIYAGSVSEVVDPRDRKYYWIGGKGVRFENIAGSDSEAVSQNHISITPIRTDLTDYGALERLNDLKV